MMQLEGKLEVARACELAQVSRAGFYRVYAEHEPRQAEMAVRDLVQQIVLENRCYGYRRVGAELRHRGWVVNHKRVLRIMRQDNLLCLAKRRFVLTTDSRHPYGVFPNLTQDLQLSAVNQLWVADITYIRLREEFVYLAVVLDAFSRKVLGWDLQSTMEADLVITALDRALAERSITPGVIHHSDQGVQYASKPYVEKLLAHGFRISMSRKASPWQNARAEAFMKTLKAEEVHLRQYRDLEEARSSIAHFLETIYNERRLHSSLGYVSPLAFEEQISSSGTHTGSESAEGPGR
jgi:transposase InsO family protein